LKRLRPFDLGKLILVVELELIFFFALRPATDPDYGWHIANGRHVLDGLTFAGRDLYSWTATNVWVAHEWLTEAIMNFVHAIAGSSGNSVIAAIVVAATYACVMLGLRKRGIPASLAAVALPVCFAGALRSLAVRPHVVEMFFLAALVFLIDRFLAGDVSRRRFVGIVIGGALLWVNMHGSFPLLTVMMLITSAELLLISDRRWLVFVQAAFVSACIFIANPWGLRIYAFAVQSIRSHPTLAYIKEWQPPVLTEWLAFPLILQFFLTTVGVLWVVRRFRFAKSESHSEAGIPFSIGILRAPAFAFLALQSGRHMMLFGIANAWLIAVGAEFLVSRLRVQKPVAGPMDAERSVAKEAINIGIAVMVAVAVIAKGWGVISPHAQKSAVDAAYPVRIVPELERRYSSSDRLFNEYRWGGFLIEHTSIPVFIDGRSELYGDRQLERYGSIVHLEQDWLSRLDSMEVTLVLMPRASPLATALDKAGWRTVAIDSVAALLSRN
jgi:hypothetical protein